MKQLTVLILLFWICIANSYAQLELDPNVKEVTVFYVGAEITHKLGIELQPGLNTIILKNVSSKILPRAVQILEKDLILINASLERRFSDDEIKAIEDKREIFTNQLDALNKKVNELSNVNDASILNSLLAYYESKGMALKMQIRKIEAKLLETKLANETFKDEHTANLRMLVSNSAPINKQVRLKYLTGGAGWAPFYEIFAESNKKELDLKYIVKVMNQTGEDWNEVQLYMSAAFPLEAPQRLPEINPWYITNRFGTDQREIAPAQAKIGELSLLGGVEYVETKVPTTSTKVKVPSLQSVPANGAVYSFGVFTSTLPISFVYHAVPSVNASAFLIVQVTDWRSLQLLDATAKVNLNGTLVGNTLMEISEANSDTLNITLGKDDGITVKKAEIGNRTFKKEKNNKIKETVAYEFTVKNNLTEDAELYLFDQVPISQTNNVKVDFEQFSSGRLNDENGEVVWQYSLKPGEEKKNIQLIYTIEYPKGYASSFRLRLSKKNNFYRKASRPKF